MILVKKRRNINFMNKEKFKKLDNLVNLIDFYIFNSNWIKNN